MIGHYDISANGFSFLNQFVEVVIDAGIEIKLFKHWNPFVTGKSYKVESCDVFNFNSGTHVTNL